VLIPRNHIWYRTNDRTQGGHPHIHTLRLVIVSMGRDHAISLRGVWHPKREYGLRDMVSTGDEPFVNGLSRSRVARPVWAKDEANMPLPVPPFTGRIEIALRRTRITWAVGTLWNREDPLYDERLARSIVAMMTWEQCSGRPTEEPNNCF
jgi:hypothetical protein